jgi:hypothetical protein
MSAAQSGDADVARADCYAGVEWCHAVRRHSPHQLSGQLSGWSPAEGSEEGGDVAPSIRRPSALLAVVPPLAEPAVDGAAEGAAEASTTSTVSRAPSDDRARRGARPASREVDAAVGELFALFATPLYVHTVRQPVAHALNRKLLAAILRLSDKRKERGVHRSNQGGWQSPPDLLRSGWLAPPLAGRFRTQMLGAISAMIKRLSQAHLVQRGTAPVRVRASSLHAWANVNRAAGDSNELHVHPEAMISGVYYVTDAADSLGTAAGCSAVEPEGSLELLDPRFALRIEAERRANATGGSGAREEQVDHRSADTLATDAMRQLDPGFYFQHSPPVHVQASAGSFVLFPAGTYHRVHAHRLPSARVTIAFNVWLEDEEAGSTEGVRRVLDGVYRVPRVQ